MQYVPIVLGVAAIISSISIWAVVIIWKCGQLIGRYQENQLNQSADIAALQENSATKEELRLVQTSHSEALGRLVKSIGGRFDRLEERFNTIIG